MAIAHDRGKLVFRKTERELFRLASEQRPEAVHGFRMSARRLQTLLEQLIPARDRNQKKLLKMLNRIRRRAGYLRDIDVQLAALRSLKVPLEPRRKTLLMHRLIELRGEHERKLRKLLKRTDVREIHKRLKKASKAFDSDNARDPIETAKQILGSVIVPAGGPDDDTLHRYRLAVKRARYAAEFATKSGEADQFIIELKQLQDALGSWHDWQTLTQTASRQLGEVGQSSLVAVLHNVTRGKLRHALSALAQSPASTRVGKKASLASDVLPSSSRKRTSSAGRTETAA